MNYAGKFDAAISDGQGARAPVHGQVESVTAKGHGHVPEGAFVIPDANLIFHGTFKRAGADLVLSHDGHEFVVEDYFRGDKRAAIASPDGAHLTGEIVSALTGHVQVAQAGGGAASGQVIGHVTKLVGSAAAVRNGVSIILNNGDNVEKGDVVSTGGDSTLGITFIDGTVFGLSSNARMVLNEMVYDPNGSNNSSLLSLVAGTITFVAGETAKHGDMKIDTPVATMGIRGTAVLTQINFIVPAGGGDPQPQANFQVLVEPNGTTGSYILFDKITLLPIATVNQAGQVIQISGGNVSIGNALLSPEVRKLITDVFTLKFTDNNTNTKLTTNFTDTITPTNDGLVIKTAAGSVAIPTFVNINQQSGPPVLPGDKTTAGSRIPGPPEARSLDLSGNVKTAFALTEQPGTTGGDTPDQVSGRITFLDFNQGDRPTVKVNLAGAPNYVYKSAGQQDVTSSLTDLQKQDIAATQIQINVVADGGNDNNGSAVWTYKIPDKIFDFLAAGETLTLTYIVRVDNNFEANNETTFIPITITVTGTNDKPVITTGVPIITFEGGTSVPGGPLESDVPTSGTLTFTDVDLTDSHSVAVKLTSATLPGGTVPPGPLALFESAMSLAIANGADSKGSGTGTISWSLEDLPVYIADFIPKGEVLTLVYTVTVTDSQGATSQQTITVTITGTDAPAVVWIATAKAGAPSGGFWKDAANWETGTVPTIDDDVIVITDQLHGLTPSYPVTIDSAAYAKSLTMNDFGGPPPQVINKSSLTIAGALTIAADAILINTAQGTMAVGGKAEILGTSVLTNAGTLTLSGGGDFAAASDITNSGTLELAAGTLTTKATIHNAGGTLEADGGATIVVDGTTIDGGTVKILGTLQLDGTSLLENGTLNNSGLVKVRGAAEFAQESVDNKSAGTIEIVASGALTIDQSSSVTNAGHITVDSGGKLTINKAGISGTGTITGNGEIDLTGSAVLGGGKLKNNASLEVSGTGNALHGETVTNAGTLDVLANGALTVDQGSTVDNAAGNLVVDAKALLTLNSATISGGAIKGAGAIDVTGASKIDGGAAISIDAITADAKLTLDGATVSATTITDKSSIELDGTVTLKGGATIAGTSAALKGAITNDGLLLISGAATLRNELVTNTAHAVRIGDGQTLTLAGTTITGGTIDNYSGALGGTIDVVGDSTIDGDAVLNKGLVTVESGITLTLDDATLANASVTNLGTVAVESGKKLKLAGAGLTGGTISLTGTLSSSGTSTITNATVTNALLLESTLGGLLTLIATSPAAAITNSGTIQANGAELDINGEAVTNKGTLQSINNGTLKLISTTVTNGVGAVSVEAGSTLDLVGSTIAGGTVTIAGTLESTGTSAINDADIHNTGTITVTSGTLTIDPAVVHAITNQGLMQADGGVLDISIDPIVNTADIKAINGGTLKLSGLTLTNTGGTITIDSSSELDLVKVTVTGGHLTNSGKLTAVSGANGVSAAVTNTGTIEVQGGTLNLSGGLSGVGTLIIDDGATLELAGATAQTISFGGGSNTLQLDKVAGQSFSGTITGEATKGGTFTIAGAADITTASGDALDLTAGGGSAGKPGNIVLTPSGALTGAANGLVVIQNGTGDITLTATGNIKGLAGNGITLRDGATGVGDIKVDNLTGKATGTGANSVGVLVENLNPANDGDISITQLGGAAGGAFGIDATTQGDGDVTIDAGGNISGGSTYGIRARSFGSGDITVSTRAGSLLSSGSSGITAVNRAVSLDATVGSTITVNAYGAINSGSSANLSGNAPAGIQAGYAGAQSGTNANTDVNGTVVVNNYGSITATAGNGIDAYNYGNGNVTVTSADGTAISATGSQSIGINATALSGGAGNVSVRLGENVTISGVTSYGIRAYSVDQGNIDVTLGKGDKITSGSSGIVAVNFADAIGAGVHSTIHVTAHGTIHSGTTSNNDGTTPGGIIAGYKPSGNAAFSNTVKGDVTVDSDAVITADAGYGIEAFTWGVGKVTVTTGTKSEITAAGTAIGAFDHGGGDVTVTNHGSATGAVGLSALAIGNGSITIDNDGELTGTSLTGISITQNASGATGSSHITNGGSILGASGHAAIFIQGNATGTVLIDNSGTIGPDDSASVTASTYAIVETGGVVTINNSGDINGNISVATATFNNEAGGTWTVAGSGVFGNLSKIINAGEIDLHGAAISGAGLAITNNHEIDSWGTASISGTITNTGAIEVHDGTLTLFGTVSGAGSVTVDAGATLTIEDTVSQTITLAGDGATLRIDTTSFGGAIAGLSATDKIDLSTIKYGLGTSAVYVANADPSTGGVLTVTDADGHHISLNLTGADYVNAHFAGSSDGHGGTLITYNAADDAPAFTATGATLTAAFSELADTTGSAALDPAPAATGSVAFTDIDLTDRPTATVTSQSVSWLAADHATQLSLASDQVTALEHALSIQQTGNNNGSVGWSYAIADSTLDFLAEGQTATVVSTITLDDHQGHTATTDVTVTITGRNDKPTLANENAGTLTDTSATDSFATLTGQLVGADADSGETASLSYAVLDGQNHAMKALAGQYGVLTVNANGGYGYLPDAAAINALSAGSYADVFTVQTTDVHGAMGTATLTVHVTGANDAPTLGGATLAAVDEDAGAPAGSTVGDLFGSGFHDVDAGSSLAAVAITADHADAASGVWQYQVPGSHQWSDIAGVGGATALVLGTDTLIRFLPAANFSGVPGALEAHALDNTYGGGSTGASPVSIDIAAAGSSASTGAATLSTEVTPVVDPPVFKSLVVNYLADSLTGDVIDTGHWRVVLPTLTPPADGHPAVTPTTNGVVLHDSGYLETVTGFGPTSANPLQINLSFSLEDSTGSFVEVTDGTDGTINPATGEQANGLSFVFGFGKGLTISNMVASGPPLNLASNTLYDAMITDTGTHQTVVIVNHATGDRVGTYSSDFTNDLAGDLVTITNREAYDGHYGATVSNVIISNAFEAIHGTPLALTGLTGVTDPDGSEHLSLDLSGFPAGTTFSVGHAGTGADAGHWLISAANVASLGGAALTMTAPDDYAGEFTLHVSGTVVDTVSGLTGQLTDTRTFSNDVAVAIDSDPVINVDQVRVMQEGGHVFVRGLSVSDSDAAPGETFTLATTAASGTSVDPASVADTLAGVNAALTELDYLEPGKNGPATDKVTVTVTDGHGASDTVNLIFNLSEQDAVTLAGTTGKDVFFGTGYQDQFVFAANSGHDTILNFTSGEDHINLSQLGLSSIVTPADGQAWIDQHSTHPGSDTLIAINAHDTILLKNVAQAQASDFIFHA